MGLDKHRGHLETTFTMDIEYYGIIMQTLNLRYGENFKHFETCD